MRALPRELITFEDREREGSGSQCQRVTGALGKRELGREWRVQGARAVRLAWPLSLGGSMVAGAGSCVGDVPTHSRSDQGPEGLEHGEL